MNSVLYFFVILTFCVCTAFCIKYTSDTFVSIKHKGDKKAQTVYRQHDEICVCCGEYVPEGRMICPRCENHIHKGEGK